MSPKVSVLMPAYNVDKYIGDAIDSILSQTYCDFELIVVDDFSTDNTWAVIESRSKLDSRIIAIKNSSNSGIAASLNNALHLCKGEYIVRMDADDISLPNRIELLLNEINERNLDLLGSATITIDELGNEIGCYKPLIKHDHIVDTIKYASPILHIWICRKELYSKVGSYRNPPVEDYDFILRCIKHGAKLGNSKEKLYKVRIRGGNTADLYGFKQLRAFEMTYKNFKKNALDTVNYISRFDELNEFLYKKSYKILMEGSANLKKGNKVRAGFYFVLSAMVSSYQFRYLKRRLGLFFYQRRKRIC